MRALSKMVCLAVSLSALYSPILSAQDWNQGPNQGPNQGMNQGPNQGPNQGMNRGPNQGMMNQGQNQGWNQGQNQPAPPVIINNNNSQPQQASSQPGCPPANQNNIYDPRVAPAGAYYTKNPDGSGQQTFTTGEKKPYITDNNCGGGSSNQAQPQVIVAPSARR